MENRINTKIVITVSRNEKLLSCLRKLDSGEAASVNVEINYAYKKKPIKLSFLKIKTPTKTSDDFLVYAECRSSKSSNKVVLGNASIKNIQESGFVSIGNKEAKECVIINTYSKNDSTDFRELKKVLLDIMQLESYTPLNCTPHKDFANSTILVELKPENSKIINYEVSIVPAVKTGKVQKDLQNASVSQDDSSLRKRELTVMARKNLSRALKTTTGDIPTNELTEGSSGLNHTQLMLKKRHESKTESHAEETKKEENNDKYTTVAFECTLKEKELGAKFFLQRNFRDYSIEFNTIAGNFNGEIKHVSIEDKKAIAWTEIKVEDAKKLNLDQDSGESQETLEVIKALTRLRLIEKPKKEVGKLYYKIPFPHCVGSVSMDSLFLKVESTVEHKKKSPTSDYSPEMSVDTIDNKIKTELVSFSCSIPNVFIRRLVNKDNNSIDTANLSVMFEVGNKVFSGAITKVSIDADSKQVNFPMSNDISTTVSLKIPMSNDISTTVSLEILIDNVSKKIIQNLLDKTGLKTAAVGKLMLATTINDNTNQGSAYIRKHQGSIYSYKPLKQIGVIYINKDSLLNNSNSKKSNSTATESEKGTQEVLKQRHNTDNRKSDNIESELVIASSMLRSDLEKPLKRWKKILKAKSIEILTHISLRAGHVLDFYIREVSIGVDRDAYTGLITRYELIAKYSLNNHIVNKGKQEVVISGFVFKALHNAYAEYKQRKSENLDISHLESLLEKNQKSSNQKRDKDLISIIAEALREIESIGKANVSKSSKATATENLFCKKTKVNSKRNNNTKPAEGAEGATTPATDATRPYQVLNPLVTILASDESKNKVKEIIEEANRTKSFPYKLDYNNNCVVKISDSPFDILECKNKLENILKIRKDIDVGIFTLEPTDGLVFKKRFNISSLTVYYSVSKNIYALIGA